MPGRKAGEKSFGNLIEAVSDIALLVDGDGVVRHLVIPKADLWRELAGGVQWFGRPCVEIVSAESRTSVEELLSDGAGMSSPSWRAVLHRSSHGLDVPILYKAVPTDDRAGGFVAIGRDLQAMEFTGLIRTHHAAVARVYVEALRSRGATVETLLLDLLGPAARRLGDLWVEDLCAFTEVTVGLWRLHQLLRGLGSGGAATAEAPQDVRQALLLPAPGEQHVFGLAIVAEFLRRDGWNITDSNHGVGNDPGAMVRRTWFDMVGFSMSCESRLDLLATAIRRVRRASRNPAVGIMVGGRVFNENPEFVARVGADTTAADGRSAVLQAAHFGTSTAPVATVPVASPAP